MHSSKHSASIINEHKAEILGNSQKARDEGKSVPCKQPMHLKMSGTYNKIWGKATRGRAVT